MNSLCGILLSKSYNKNFRVDHYCSSQPWFSDFEALLECFAGYFFVFVEGVGVDVQRSGGLGVAQEAGHRSYVCAVGDQKAGVAMSEAMHV